MKNGVTTWRHSRNFANAGYERHPGDCDPERLQSPRCLQGQLAPLMASPARENPAALKYPLLNWRIRRKPRSRMLSRKPAKMTRPAAGRTLAFRAMRPLRNRDQVYRDQVCGRADCSTNSGTASRRYMMAKVFFAPFRSGTTHVVSFRAIFPDRPVPGWAQKRHQIADGAAQMENQNGCVDR